MFTVFILKSCNYFGDVPSRSDNCSICTSERHFVHKVLDHYRMPILWLKFFTMYPCFLYALHYLSVQYVSFRFHMFKKTIVHNAFKKSLATSLLSYICSCLISWSLTELVKRKADDSFNCVPYIIEIIENDILKQNTALYLEKQTRKNKALCYVNIVCFALPN